MTTQGATSREGGTEATSSPSRPVIQWLGASKCVPTCSPPSNQFQYQAGPRSSYREISCVVQPGVFANGGGSCRIGVRSDSGCVRSTTRTRPEASPSASEARTVTASFLRGSADGGPPWLARGVGSAPAHCMVRVRDARRVPVSVPHLRGEGVLELVLPG